MDKYIIVELIPTTRFKNTGDIAQLCALKCTNNRISKLNLRLELEKVQVPDILNMINYDIDNFEYLSSTDKILSKFKTWAKDYKLLIIPNDYTIDYLSDLENEKVSICDIFKTNFSELIIDDICNMYGIDRNQEIVDIIYNAIKNMK
ncbi:MAG: hypothetical protein E7170_00930 [Firmicutes bacterium]|nr:hypothetical protein [Bacillota bacterium]